MALLKVLTYPDKRLHRIAKPVAVIDDGIRKLVRDMFDTMYHADGIGLAATQVNVHKQVVVIDISETGNQPLILINPHISWHSTEKAIHREGCLSVPEVFETVERAAEIEVRAQDLEGQEFSLKADGWLAVCIQHELDHLMGKVFVEYLPLQKRNRIKSKMLAEMQ
jgi:peptide deformylase